MAQFTLAVNRQFTNADGEKEADFIPCVVWRKQAELLAEHTKKGYQVGIEGRNQTRQYDKDGNTVYVMEVVVDSIEFLEPKREQVKEEVKQETTMQDNRKFVPNTEEDLPF
jgi:single-strand DNA-binding protein